MKLSLLGFKCFVNSDFSFSKITALTGSNGTGKSSVIQSLLLLRLGIERNFTQDERGDFTINNWKGNSIPLNSGYELNLGTVNDIVNGESSSVQFILDHERFTMEFPKEKDNGYAIDLTYDLLKSPDEAVHPLHKKQFYYLCTERLGPKMALTANHTEFLNCGYKGEYAGQILVKYPFMEISDERYLESTKSKFLAQQVDAWLNLICPGTLGVNVTPLGSMYSQIKLRSSVSNSDVSAPNIGFGISYSLPIIITGLIAEENSVFIVENPEAHLHPKGQSNIGYFLGLVASAGIKVIIETHSEHVVNGIRRAAFSKKSITSEDISIYFFNNTNPGLQITSIKIDSTGNLSDFPLDFFDQSRQDLLEIIKRSNE